jgi:hypothetical protein
VLGVNGERAAGDDTDFEVVLANEAFTGRVLLKHGQAAEIALPKGIYSIMAAPAATMGELSPMAAEYEYMALVGPDGLADVFELDLRSADAASATVINKIVGEPTIGGGNLNVAKYVISGGRLLQEDQALSFQIDVQGTRMVEIEPLFEAAGNSGTSGNNGIDGINGIMDGNDGTDGNYGIDSAASAAGSGGISGYEAIDGGEGEGAATDASTGEEAGASTGEEAGTEAGASAEMDASAETDAGGASKSAGANAGTDASTSTDANMGIDANTNTDASTGADTAADTGAIESAEADAGTGANAGTDTSAGTDANTSTGTDANTSTDTNASTDTMGADANTNTYANMGADTAADAGAIGSAEADAGTGADAGTDAGADMSTEADGEPPQYAEEPYSASMSVAQGGARVFSLGMGAFRITETLPFNSGYGLAGIYLYNEGTGRLLGSAASQGLDVLVAQDVGAVALVFNRPEPIVPEEAPAAPQPSAPETPSTGNPDAPNVVPPLATAAVEFAEEELPYGAFLAEHVRYIDGYPDGTVRPDGTITRAETAAIIFRLLADQGKDRQLAAPFSDIEQGKWYAQPVAYLAARGIIDGYPDGTFKPDQPITRAEFAKMASGFDSLEEASYNVFSDIDGHWASGFINSAAAKGWVSGYEGSEFRPEGGSSRAEVVTIVNRMLGRQIEPEDIPDWAPSYTDLSRAHWAYAAIIEASAAHSYEYKDNGFEIWTGNG